MLASAIAVFGVEFRLRAAVFVNMVALREATSLKHGMILPPECVRKLQSANYLLHAALNSNLYCNGACMACALCAWVWPSFFYGESHIAS